MLLSERKLVTLSAGVMATLFSTGVACAIGPSDQNVTDAVAIPNPALYGVTFISSAAGLGTGTVIGTEQDPLGGGNYKDIIDVLTANHVVGGANYGTVQFGANAVGAPTATFNWAYWQNYWATDLPGNPGLPEDIAVIQATAINLPANVWNQITASTATVANPGLGLEPGGNPFLYSSSQAFTEIGYGRMGTYNAAIATLAGTPPGYLAVPGTSGTRRFQNNNQTGLLAPAQYNYDPNQNYYQPEVTFNVANQSNAGGGAALQGDSGGPLFTGPYNGSPVLSGVNRGDGNIPINFTNNLSAVLVSGTTRTDGAGNVYFVVGDQENSVPIDSGLYDWLSTWINNPSTVPEPGSLALLAFGGIPLLLRRRRKA